MEATGCGKQMSGNFIDYIRLDLIIFLKKVCERKYSPYYTSLFIHFPPSRSVQHSTHSLVPG